MPRQWFIKTKSGHLGPLSPRKLARLALKGKLHPNMGVSHDAQSWFKAKQVPGLEFPAPPHDELDAERPCREKRGKESIQWYVLTKHHIAGPFTHRQLRKLARRGRLDPNVAVSRDQQKWTKAKRIAGLKFADPLPPHSPPVVDSAIEPDQDSKATCSSEPQQLSLFGEFALPQTVSSLTETLASCLDDTDRLWPTDGQLLLFADEFAADELADEEFAADEFAVEGDSSAAIVAEVKSITTQPTATQHSDPLAESSLPVPAGWNAVRETEYARVFGECQQVSRADDTGGHEIDVFVFPPSPQRPMSTLVTSGMSDCRMTVPEGKYSPRAELLMYVSEPFPEAIELLRSLATLPQQYQRGFWYGGSMGNGDPAKPIFRGSVLDSFMFMFPLDPEYGICETARIENDPLQLLWVIPITASERTFLNRYGRARFCELLDYSNHSITLNPYRSCYVATASLLAH